MMHRMSARSRAGFSLVEVLIAVLILAIGLLGLGAVIPVVVRSQRDATDATTGVSVANVAKDMITRQLLRENDRVSAWDVFLDSQTWSSNYEWDWGPVIEHSYTAQLHSELHERRVGRFEFFDEHGEYFWGNITGSSALAQRVERRRSTSDPWQVDSTFGAYSLNVRDRLWPMPAIRGAGADLHRPQFVWDFVARRVDPRVESNHPLKQPLPNGAPRRLLVEPEIQIAIFVRRIDMNIRVPRGLTLFDVLTLPSSSNDHRYPVAVATRGSEQGMPTLNGEGEYAVPITLSVSEYTRDSLTLRGGTENQRRLASQVGQRLVDNHGNIYTVRQLNPDNSVQVVPPVPEHLRNNNRLTQVVFTPQVPVAVQIVNIKRPVVQP